MRSLRWSVLTSLILAPASSLADKPCDAYPRERQPRCEALWKEINDEAAPEMARFGLAQLKRRQEGKISAEQHLKENTEFIKRSAERRLQLLKERMDRP